MKTMLRSLLAALVLSAPLAACTAPVDSTETGESEQAAAVQAKPVSLTAVDAKFARWLPTPSGKIGGMMLDNGTIVQLGHGPEGASIDANSLKAGDAIKVEGFQKDSVFKHATISKDGNVLVKAPEFKHHAFKGPKGDNAEKGEWKHHKKGEWNKGEGKGEWKHGDKAAFEAKMQEFKAKHAQELAALADVSSTGTVETVLTGHHGRVHGVILSDGTVAYLPHHSGLKDVELKKGDSITISGKGGSYDIGKSMIIQSVTLPSGEVKKA